MPPETSILKSGRSELERALQPASPGHMQWCLNKLFVLPTRDGAAVTTAFQADNFIDACGHFPDDLWTTATLEILQTKTFRPVPAEMVEAIGARFRERQRMLERVNVMLGGQARVEGPKPFVREPEDVRLRTVKSGWMRIGNFDRANKAEARLAEIENRRPEFIEPPAQKAPRYVAAPPSLPASPDMQARLNMAIAVRYHEQGYSAVARRLEADARALAPHLFAPPVEHRDVPEVA